ncbi:MAG TPA: carboxymuconolactone decarboxylase family protein [Steroidobacteraceae bacterium]|nr:carboxymuconolactone decarboxylase family protein [Steroidobacteraceae bacterium]
MPIETDRLPPIPPNELTAAQQRAADALVSGRRGALFGPFVPMLRSPELLDRAQRLGEYLRYESAIPLRLRELAILITARHYRQGYEWHVHAPAALQAGLSERVVRALAAGMRPESALPDEAVVHEFCLELHTRHAVSDATYAAALALLGEHGVVDLTAVCGYYALLALLLNVARTPLPAGAVVPWLTADTCA